jgi:hypothetical protein
MATPSSRYYQFGSGYVIFVPGQTPLYNAILPVNPTPLLIGTLQDASMEISIKVEELRGNLQLAEVLAAGDIDVKGKITLGRFSVQLFQQALPNLGTAISAGFDTIVVKEPQVIPSGSGPFTVQVDNNTNFVEDLGVAYSNGSPLVNVGSGSLTGAGQYKVNVGTGTYTFDSADAGVAILINYSYSVASQGFSLALTNSLMGATNYCQLILDQPFSGSNAIVLNNVVFTTFKVPEKRAGFTIVEMDYMASADANGNLGTWFQGISG